MNSRTNTTPDTADLEAQLREKDEEIARLRADLATNERSLQEYERGHEEGLESFVTILFAHSDPARPSLEVGRAWPEVWRACHARLSELLAQGVHDIERASRALDAERRKLAEAIIAARGTEPTADVFVADLSTLRDIC
jgi:Skp family chaperone for outer membrane proteins